MSPRHPAQEPADQDKTSRSISPIFTSTNHPSSNMKIRSGITSTAAFALALAALLISAWLAYRPGISGTFLLDDFSSLQLLGTWGPVTHWNALWRYLTAGIVDPTGRPLSLLSFLLDANDWPAAAAPFKYTNILFHLLNGALLCWAMLKLGRRCGIDETRATTSALIGSGIWLLHPLLVSTTLYVVQREAMLPATFTFIGIICWCSGRDAFDTGKVGRAIIWMVAAAWLCTLLATLCKANGILLPLLIAVAEATLLRTHGDERATNRRTRLITTTILLGLPIALLAAYLVYVLPGAVHATPGMRGWTVGQRLMSEPRVLTEYLRLLWIPQTTSFGVFNDQIHVSSGLLHPWTTLPCIIFIVGLIVAGWFARRRFPVLAFTILFYSAGQLLESSFIPLELAFEHRNYLPAAFMFWPIGLWLSAPKTRPMVGRTVAAAVLCALAVMTWTRAGVWGNLQLQGRLWGRINPDSPQAQSFSASVEAAYGDVPAALAQLRQAAARMPDRPQLALNLVNMECRTGTVSGSTWQAVMYSLNHADTGWNNIANWFVTTTPDATTHRCQGLTAERLTQAFAALKNNPRFLKWHRNDRAFQRAGAALDLAAHRPQEALTAFDVLLALNPDPATALEQAKSLNAFGDPELALRHLDYFSSLPRSSGPGFGMPRVHTWVLRKQGWWVRQLAGFRTQLEVDLAARKAVHPRLDSTRPAHPQASH